MWAMSIYAAILFFLLTPGVLVSLPPKQGKLTVAAFHAVIFALIWHFTHMMWWNSKVDRDGFASSAHSAIASNAAKKRAIKKK